MKGTCLYSIYYVFIASPLDWRKEKVFQKYVTIYRFLYRVKMQCLEISPWQPILIKTASPSVSGVLVAIMISCFHTVLLLDYNEQSMDMICSPGSGAEGLPFVMAWSFLGKTD